MDKSKVFYHFTCSYLLNAIMQSGYINLTASNFSFEQIKYPVVWLTDLPTPDNHGLLIDKNIPDDLNKTHIRFTIRNRPFIKQWDAWSDAKGMDKQLKQFMITSASAEDTYKSWYVSEQIIQIAKDVICVENLATGQIMKF